MREYELTVLFHPDLEMNLDPATGKVEKLIADAGGKVTKVTADGKKRLNYQIEGQDYAVYYFYDVELPGDTNAKLENGLTLADEVIRHLLVTKDPRKEKYEARRKELEARAAEQGEDKEETEE